MIRKILLTALVLLPLITLSQQPEQLTHNSKSYVDDYADVFTPEQENELDVQIRKFFDTVQISIVTLNTFGGIDPGEYATRLGRSWGVGGKSNNGLLIIIAIKDRKMFMATGYGIEGDLTDYKTQEIQQEYGVPRFKEGKYYTGTMDMLLACINELSPSAKELRRVEEEKRKEIREQRNRDMLQAFLTFLVCLGIITLIALPFYLRWRKKKREEVAAKEAARLAAELLSAKKFLLSYPEVEPHGTKYNMNPYYAGVYIEKRKNIQELVNRNELIEYASLIYFAQSAYWNIKVPEPVVDTPYTPSTPSSNSKRASDDDDSYSRRSSSNDSYNSSSNDSYNSGGSSSSFGGGSFGGGGSGSNW